MHRTEVYGVLQRRPTSFSALTEAPNDDDLHVQYTCLVVYSVTIIFHARHLTAVLFRGSRSFSQKFGPEQNSNLQLRDLTQWTLQHFHRCQQCLLAYRVATGRFFNDYKFMNCQQKLQFTHTYIYSGHLHIAYFIVGKCTLLFIQLLTVNIIYIIHMYIIHIGMHNMHYFMHVRRMLCML